MVNYISVHTFRNSNYELRMANKKNKKKKIKQPLKSSLFPGYDLHICIAIFMALILVTCTGCSSWGWESVDTHHHHNTHLFHYDHHYHDSHRRYNDRRSKSATPKFVTPLSRATNPPPPSRPISKGVPEPPRSPRERR